MLVTRKGIILHFTKKGFYMSLATHRCSYEKVLWKCTANLQENTHAEVQFQNIGMGALL